MRRTVFIVPELLGEPSVLRQNLPSLRAMAEMAQLVKLAPMPAVQTPEALFLGMSATEAQMAQGPLTVAALGADPPDRSVHFHLSLMSRGDDGLSQPKHIPTLDEQEAIWNQLSKLNTKTLTLLRGQELDHALVWEGLGEFATFSPADAVGPDWRKRLPEGDAEVQLRRLIDDSANLLDELELNERRLDEGLEPFNIVWPWGDGIRVRVPNLALRRGEPAVVESGSLRLQGLARLAGYKHENRRRFGRGINVRLASVAERALGRDLTIVMIETPAELRSSGRLEELEWFTKRIDDELLAPLLDSALRQRERIALLAPSAQHLGLAVVLDSGEKSANTVPFDERALEERTVPTRDLNQMVESAVEPMGAMPGKGVAGP